MSGLDPFYGLDSNSSSLPGDVHDKWSVFNMTALHIPFRQTYIPHTFRLVADDQHFL